jgi:hypothetical protein
MARRIPSPRYGIAEWYGNGYLNLTDEQRQNFAELVLNKAAPPACPFQDGKPPCNKPSGVCSIRRYNGVDGALQVAESGSTAVCITCPNRFKQDGMIYRWIGQELLGTEAVANLGEIGFLDRVSHVPLEAGEAADEVGRIDNILVVPHTSPLQWCAVETQAVYFSGKGMQTDFQAMRDLQGSAIVSRATRRPDFRSSAPKRLMPQLQIKVPTLSRWGKKTAVVVDEAFFNSLGPMKFEDDKSNADIGWFVVAAGEGVPVAPLMARFTKFTTLLSAVEGLTAGKPVSQSVFEQRISERLAERNLA